MSNYDGKTFFEGQELPTRGVPYLAEAIETMKTAVANGVKISVNPTVHLSDRDLTQGRISFTIRDTSRFFSSCFPPCTDAELLDEFLYFRRTGLIT